MLSLNRNTRLFFFQYIFQRDYSTDFELDEFIAKNIKKRPFNKKKLKSLYDSFKINNQIIKNLLTPEIIKKTNKISIFLIYAFFSEFLLDRDKKKILMHQNVHQLHSFYLLVPDVNTLNVLHQVQVLHMLQKH